MLVYGFVFFVRREDPRVSTGSGIYVQVKLDALLQFESFFRRLQNGFRALVFGVQLQLFIQIFAETSPCHHLCVTIVDSTATDAQMLARNAFRTFRQEEEKLVVDALVVGTSKKRIFRDVTLR